MDRARVASRRIGGPAEIVFHGDRRSGVKKTAADFD
jgi:hypothetical protein